MVIIMENIELLFQKYKDDVYRLAVSYTKSLQDAEDVCQNVFLKLMRQSNIDPGKEKSWLMRVTANECRSLLRSHWWKTTVSLDEHIAVEPPEMNDVLQSVLALEPKYRVVVYLHYYEMLSTEEIASLLHITRSAVTTRLSRARKMLKEILQEV